MAVDDADEVASVLAFVSLALAAADSAVDEDESPFDAEVGVASAAAAAGAAFALVVVTTLFPSPIFPMTEFLLGGSAGGDCPARMLRRIEDCLCSD